ncbi:IS110 family RNA-guided transposase [Arthrobacter sp. B2a2-09]|uniref:IS110 family transposase n=1 Tax=Arthrobacter sp. B2a2-09 TaxID=2952822 RepID=UPI0022CD643A|nr:IS110 family transposase [Arthrobacter sp. B2a2-09]MCZ9880699.1 IS110 family transposase [Arthrobacter sp. B2a2-09]
MEVIHPRCAGVDVSKKDAKVCVRVQGRGTRSTTSTVTTWASMTGQILDLKEHLLNERVTLVVMEATSDYWRPFYYLLEDEGLDVILVNARDARNVPGRKTDVSDAAWLADLGAHGLVRASFVPPPPIRELRDLTRARTVITRERTREVQRLEKLLEDACIKLSSVASDITGVSGRLMLQALIDGQDDPAVLAELAHGRMRAKIPELTDALTGRFLDHHRYMAALYLHRIDAHTADINDLSARIEEAMEPFRDARELLISIPGFSTTVAEVFIAETGADMTVFPTPQQLASWAGTSPGANESAGRVKSAKTRPGNRYLKGALGIAALSASRSNGTYFSAKYRRIASRRGPVKALVAVEHAMLTAAWHMLSTGELYRDPGADYFTRRTPSRTKAHAIGQLESLGYKVTIEPLTATR